jgi:hypothetical protein
VSLRDDKCQNFDLKSATALSMYSCLICVVPLKFFIFGSFFSSLSF